MWYTTSISVIAFGTLFIFVGIYFYKNPKLFYPKSLLKFGYKIDRHLNPKVEEKQYAELKTAEARRQSIGYIGLGIFLILLGIAAMLA